MFYRFEFDPPVSDKAGKMVMKAVCKANNPRDALMQLPAQWRSSAALKASGERYKEVEN